MGIIFLIGVLQKYAFFTYYFGKLVLPLSLFDVFSVCSEISIRRHTYGLIRFIITAFIDLLYIQVPSGHKRFCFHFRKTFSLCKNIKDQWCYKNTILTHICKKDMPSKKL